MKYELQKIQKKEQQQQRNKITERVWRRNINGWKIKEKKKNGNCIIRKNKRNAIKMDKQSRSMCLCMDG